MHIIRLIYMEPFNSNWNMIYRLLHILFCPKDINLVNSDYL